MRPDIGARERRIEDVGVLGEPDAQRGLRGALARKCSSKRGSRRQTHDLHRTRPLLPLTPPLTVARLYQHRCHPVLPSERLKAATSCSSAGEKPPSEGTMPSAGGSSAVAVTGGRRGPAIRDQAAAPRARQRSTAIGQRVWKWQPDGGLSGLGMSPCRMMRARLRAASAPGSPTAAPGYRDGAARRTAPRSARSRRCGRDSSRRRGRRCASPPRDRAR